MPQIFVVEDDEAIRIELVQLLERNGYEVRCAERYEHVVDEVRAAEPDLVLLDLTLPGTDGGLGGPHHRAHLPGHRDR